MNFQPSISRISTSTTYFQKESSPMTSRKMQICLLCLFALILWGCKEKREPDNATGAVVVQQSTAAPKTAFMEPVEPALFELTSGALTTWRTFSGRKPALVLFASHPLLDAIPAELADDVQQLLSSASDQEIVRRGSMAASDTLLLPPQTVSAAIAAGFFSEIVFVLPTRGKPENLSLDDFRNRALRAGFLAPPEAEKLVLKAGVISGTLHGLPFRVAHPEALPKIAGPVIIHIDLGYFRELYVNEIKTPVYRLIYDLVTSLRTAAYPALAVTLTYSNQEIGFSLDSRFMISNLADILRQPKLLDGGTPPSWELRASALYLSAMFSEDQAEQQIVKASIASPNDPSALYALALVQFRNNQPQLGFETLERTVALDRGYVIEYLDLAVQGEKLGQWDKSIELLGRVAQLAPDNALNQIRLASTLIQRGRNKEARPLLDRLARLQWSPLYHRDVPALLEEMRHSAKDDSIVPIPKGSR